MKILVVSTTDSMIWNFLIPHIKYWQSKGNTVEIACSQTGFYFEELKAKYKFQMYNVPFERSPFKLSNIRAFTALNKLVIDRRYEVIVSQEPVGGVLGRLAAHRNHLKCAYTAHGFHFFSGAPLINWMLFYPAERIMAHYTDVLVTINEEDYRRAKRFKAGHLFKLDGIGVDLKKFQKIEKFDEEELKMRLGISPGQTVILTVAEMIPRKNYKTALRALKKLGHCNFTYLICGDGKQENDLKQEAIKLGIAKQVKFLGFRKDVSEIYKISDIFLFPSYQEGLSVALIEAMAAGLPVIGSKIRGNVDLIKEGKGGYLYDPEDCSGMASGIEKIMNDSGHELGAFNKKYVNKFRLEKSVREMYAALEMLAQK